MPFLPDTKLNLFTQLLLQLRFTNRKTYTDAHNHTHYYTDSHGNTHTYTLSNTLNAQFNSHSDTHTVAESEVQVLK